MQSTSAGAPPLAFWEEDVQDDPALRVCYTEEGHAYNQHGWLARADDGSLYYWHG